MYNKARLRQKKCWEGLQETHPHKDDKFFLYWIVEILESVAIGQDGHLESLGRSKHGALKATELQEIKAIAAKSLKSLRGSFKRLDVLNEILVYHSPPDDPILGYKATISEVLVKLEQFLESRLLLSSFAVKAGHNQWITFLSRGLFFEFSILGIDWSSVDNRVQHRFIKGCLDEFAQANNRPLPTFTKKQWVECRESYFAKTDRGYSLKDRPDIVL